MTGKFVPLIYLLGITIILSGCEKLMSSPATQCLDSFKSDLKDPDSGKVISFENGVLVYTATNSYGARVQGKALCEQMTPHDKWVRAYHKEKILILDTMTKRIEAGNKCREGGKTAAECGVPRTTDLDLLEREVTRELGF